MLWRNLRRAWKIGRDMGSRGEVSSFESGHHRAGFTVKPMLLKCQGCPLYAPFPIYFCKICKCMRFYLKPVMLLLFPIPTSPPSYFSLCSGAGEALDMLRTQLRGSWAGGALGLGLARSIFFYSLRKWQKKIRHLTVPYRKIILEKN